MPTVTQSDDPSNQLKSPGLSLKDEFIPYVEEDTLKILQDSPQEDGKSVRKVDVDDKEAVKLTEYLDEEFKGIGGEKSMVVLTTNETKFKVPFDIKKGTEKSSDDDGILEFKLDKTYEGVKLLNPETKIKAKYGDKLEVEVEITADKSQSFYIDFYASDDVGDDWNDGELEDLYCGRLKVIYDKPLNLKKVYYSISIMQETNYRSNSLKAFRKFMKVKNSSFGNEELSNYLISQSELIANDSSELDGEEIHFLAIFSHGITDQIFGDSTDDIEKIEIKKMLANEDIHFSKNALIYLGACNAGTVGVGNSFAQEMASVTGATVVAMVNDGVAPVKESLYGDKSPQMIFGPKMGDLKKGKFHKFQKGKLPVVLGKTVDVLKLIDQQKSVE